MSRQRRGRVLLCGGVLLAAVAWAPAALTAYRDKPPLAHTGGFTEASCHACHFDHPLNSPGGELGLEGLPAQYRAGETYRVRVKLTRPDLGAAGFQLSARYAEGEDAGRQAGSLRALDGRVEVNRDPTREVDYAHHTTSGISLTAAGSAVWTVEWTAPDDPAAGSVVLHVAGNAANDDHSEFGDFIYLHEATVHPAVQKR